MADESYLAKKEELYSRVRNVLSTNGSHVRMEYKLPYFQDKSKEKGYFSYSASEEGQLVTDEFATEPDSFGEIADTVKEAYASLYPIKNSYDIGFRGTVYQSDERELEVTGNAGISTPDLVVREKKREVGYG